MNAPTLAQIRLALRDYDVDWIYDKIWIRAKQTGSDQVPIFITMELSPTRKSATLYVPAHKWETRESVYLRLTAKYWDINLREAVRDLGRRSRK